MEREELLVETLVGLADTLVDTYDLIDFMQTLAERCVEILDVTQAGIMIADTDGNLRHVECSSEEMRLIEYDQRGAPMLAGGLHQCIKELPHECMALMGLKVMDVQNSGNA